MSDVIVTKGDDPIPGPLRTDLKWKATGADHEVIWLGGDRMLFWYRPTGEYGIYKYQWNQKDKAVDPYDSPATSEGSWSKQNIVSGHRLLYLGGRRLLDWAPTASGTTWRLWHLEPTAKGPNALGSKRAEGTWKSITTDTRLVYLEKDWVLEWTPNGPNETHFYNVYKVVRDPPAGGDVLPSANLVHNGRWSTIGSDHEVHYIGNDRVLVWKPSNGHYRVYGLNRQAKGWDAAGGAPLLPDPILSEGQWSTIRAGHRLVFMEGKRVTDWVPATMQQRVWDVDNEIDAPTGVPGVALRRVGKDTRVAVDLLTLTKKGAPSIPDIAEKLMLPTSQVFQELVSWPENEHALQGLWTHVHFEQKYPGRNAAMNRLKVEGQQKDGAVSGTWTYYTTRRYESWAVRLKSQKPTVFSLSHGLRDLLPDAAKQQAKDLMLKAIQPNIEALEKRMQDLAVKVKMLELHIKGWRDSVKDSLMDLALLETLQGLCGLMQRHPAEALKPDDAARLEKLKNATTELVKRHNQHTILKPVFWTKDFKAARDAAADEVLKLIQDPALLADAKLMAQNVTIIREHYTRYAYETTLNAYTCLIMTDHAEHIATKHIEPLIRKLGAQFDPALAKGKKIGVPAFDEVVQASPTDPPASDDSLLASLATFTGPIPNLVGNTPGPASLAVCAVQLGTPILINKAYADLNTTHRLSGNLFRFLMRIGKFDAIQVVDALDHIRAGNLGELRKMDWSSKFQASASWAAAIGTINAIGFLAACQSNDENTARKWSNMLGSYTGASAAVIQIGEAAATALSATRICGTLNVAGRWLGTVGGVCAFATGVMTAQEELKANDTIGGVYAGMGAAAGAMTAAGFILTGGLALSATGAGAPIGFILMAVGTVLAVGSTVASYARDKLSAGTHKTFEALLLTYGRDGDKAGPYAFAKKELQPYFEEVQKLQQAGWLGGHMPHIKAAALDGETLTGKQVLKALGLDEPFIKLCVGEA